MLVGRVKVASAHHMGDRLAGIVDHHRDMVARSYYPCARAPTSPHPPGSASSSRSGRFFVEVKRLCRYAVTAAAMSIRQACGIVAASLSRSAS